METGSFLGCDSILLTMDLRNIGFTPVAVWFPDAHPEKLIFLGVKEQILNKKKSTKLKKKKKQQQQAGKKAKKRSDCCTKKNKKYINKIGDTQTLYEKHTRNDSPKTYIMGTYYMATSHMSRMRTYAP